jgi:hypothetical protein
MKTIKPFANESESIGIGELTVENRTDRVSLYGSLDLTRDKEGLRHARDLRALLDWFIGALEAATALPDKIAAPEPPETVKNPFA